MTPQRRRYFDQTGVGEEIAGVARAPVDRIQLARFCAAVNDWAPNSLDEPAARAAGLPSVVAPNSLALGLLAPLVTDWAPGMPVLKLWGRFFRMVLPGDSLVCRGRVFDREGKDGRYVVDLELWSENQRGEVVVRGGALVKLFYSAVPASAKAQWWSTSHGITSSKSPRLPCRRPRPRRSGS
jgi:acyl dehydratase